MLGLAHFLRHAGLDPASTFLRHAGLDPASTFLSRSQGLEEDGSRIESGMTIQTLASAL
jgi:hypothetical protein